MVRKGRTLEKIVEEVYRVIIKKLIDNRELVMRGRGVVTSFRT